MLHSAHNQVNTAHTKLTNWDSTSDLLLFRCMKNGKKTFNISQQQPGLSPWIHGASILDIRNTGSLIHVCSFLFSSFAPVPCAHYRCRFLLFADWKWFLLLTAHCIAHDEQHSSFQMCSWLWVNQKSWLRRLLPGVISWQQVAHY